MARAQLSSFARRKLEALERLEAPEAVGSSMRLPQLASPATK
jgi:hypothetical protein